MSVCIGGSSFEVSLRRSILSMWFWARLRYSQGRSLWPSISGTWSRSLRARSTRAGSAGRRAGSAAILAALLAAAPARVRRTPSQQLFHRIGFVSSRRDPAALYLPCPLAIEFPDPPGDLYG